MFSAYWTVHLRFKVFGMKSVFSLLVSLTVFLCGCGNVSDTVTEAVLADTVVSHSMKDTVDFRNLFSESQEGLPQKVIFEKASNKKQCFFVVSKIHPEHLSVYEKRGDDTVVLAVYPVCISLNRGQKKAKGDCRTPESYPGKPFYISDITDSHSWTHDFGDGRGEILSYGHWFMRLVTPGFKGIGIHGSTNNRESIKTGRGSEGCIRLLDEDIIHLRENYAVKGTKVIILPEDHQPLDFEKRALRSAMDPEK